MTPQPAVDTEETATLDITVKKLIDNLKAYVDSGGLTNSMAASQGKVKTLYGLFEPILQPNGRSADDNLVKALFYLNEDGQGDEKYQRMLRLKKFLRAQRVDFDDPRALDSIRGKAELVATACAAYDRHYPIGSSEVPHSSG